MFKRTGIGNINSESGGSILDTTRGMFPTKSVIAMIWTTEGSGKLLNACRRTFEEESRLSGG